ncbi:diacylglycerol kinase [Pseudorhodoferax sp.]|uniref:diacylglycerol kinase n=1 Tax=Pseudorhodoferax sp. TaxID=1993553 RepID=UPI002DD6778C|nr:diacylglycerol kinase [Pseudorhodoferax sp.]
MTHPGKGRSGLDRVRHATLNSLAGLRTAWRHEAAFRQEAWLLAAAVPAAAWLADGLLTFVLLVGAVLLVLIVELLNSGIEAAIDRVSDETHELSRRAKDMASAAVMLSLLLCATVWLVVLLQRLG